MRAWGNPADLSDVEYAAYLWAGPHPSKAEVERQVEREHGDATAKRRADEVADWRRRHPEATCSDHVAGMLADLEAACAPGATARRG